MACFVKLVITSFSFRCGIPQEANFVFDVRFLTNPYYDPGLQHLTGLNKDVGAHIEADPDFPHFFSHLTTLITPLLPRYEQAGKETLNIAIGCTGGRHRSVFVAQKLYAYSADLGYDTFLQHRDLENGENNHGGSKDTAG